MRLVIVEDHQLVLEGMEKMFNNNEKIHIVKSFSNPMLVMAYLRENYDKIDGVLTDLNMPILNGFDLIKKIKKEFPNCITIAFSMYCNQRMIEELKASNCNGFIHKAYSFENLIRAIELIGKGHKFFSPVLLKSMVHYNFIDSEKTKVIDHFGKKFYLTKRETEVLDLIVQNYSTKLIADKLFVKTTTVDVYRRNIIKKTGCKTALEFYQLAITIGIIKVNLN
jgi:DNA-binding NarL/FixJ family response regulator